MAAIDHRTTILNWLNNKLLSHEFFIFSSTHISPTHRAKASGMANEEIVKFAYSMNISKILKPALPNGYWGNICVPVYAKLTVKQLLQQSIWKTAEMIKKSKNSVTDEYVRSYIDFQELHYAKGITAGKFVSGFTDWRHLGHAEVDFGWGSPVSVLPLSWRILGSSEPTFFLPCGKEDGGKKEGFKVLVCLQENAMKAFSSEMEMFKTEENKNVMSCQIDVHNLSKV